MNTFLFVFVIALLVSTTFILFLLYSGSGRFFTKQQSSLRDSHIQKIPRLGGVGITLGFLVTISLAYSLIGRLPNSPENPLSLALQGPLIVFLIGGFAIFLVGLADDLWNIRIRYKLLGQILVAVFVSWFAFSIEKIDLPVYGTQELGFLGFPITVFWIVGVMNALNLIDGLDGLASGVSMIALAGLLIISVIQVNVVIIVFSLALIGAILGFWLFNRHPASIFMGDSGSLFLGYCLSTLSIWGMSNTETNAVNLLPIVLLGLPILDTLFSFFRRYIQGIPFYSADRDHMHHRLLAKGYSIPQSVLVMYLIAAGFSLLALAVYWQPSWYLVMCLAAILLGYFSLLFMEYKEIKAPFKMMKETAILKRQRSFVNALSEHIDVFFEKDTSLEDLLKSFSFWASQMKIVSYSIEAGKKLNSHYHEPLSVKKSISRQLVYDKAQIRVTLNFYADELDVDSDVKGMLMDRVIQELIKNICRFSEDETEIKNTISAPLRRKETTEHIAVPDSLDYN
ncbi:MAG: undecaprenyl/decaprenyl-phosphate alpha-N-acetylglucosaminyl 1-phosphate transferase [SAR324 cluster bacterium]|nr:undecaprenyl/decaprenyl-phosphate alpha-N-acetylglucosaminyl 1-phosphate transferase [SAR324 cluster bacterium]